MKINISQIYEKNILNKYDETNREAFKKDFSPNQQEMWIFTLELIKDNFPQDSYDSISDKSYLEQYLEIHLSENGVEKFSLDEWFNYLKSKE